MTSHLSIGKTMREIAGIEMLHINKDTTIAGFKNEMRWNEVYYMLNKSLYM